MAAGPSQKETLELMLAEIVLQSAEIAAQTAAITAMAADIAAQSVLIAAQAADVALSAAESTKQKQYGRWTAEYLAGQNVELVDIEAGTHVFP